MTANFTFLQHKKKKVYCDPRDSSSMHAREYFVIKIQNFSFVRKEYEFDRNAKYSKFLS